MLSVCSRSSMKKEISLSEELDKPVYGSLKAGIFPQPCKARIVSVDEGSPAQRAGLKPGMVVTAVNDTPLRDIIEWQWQSDGLEVELELEDGDIVTLEREFGESWGIAYDDSIFDGLMTCCNNCTFCFMSMLPKGMRSTLYMRDDDYRLSFLQGNFVTLTNVDDEELERIIELRLSPLHVSLHAVSPDVRQELMGRNAQRGLDVLERLLDAGLEVHVQVVLVPGVNDGPELVRTLSWIEAHPGVLSAGFVPLGYTKHQDRFSSSYSDDSEAAAGVIELIREFQEDSGVERRNPRLQIADEFYIDAGYDFPPAFMYAEFPQFQDGIGMMRSFIDEWNSLEALIAKAADGIDASEPVTIVTGTAFAKVLDPLIESSPLNGKLRVLPIENAYFGGNVDVTCLLTGRDVIDALSASGTSGTVLLAREMFNQDLKTLDDVELPEIEETCNVTISLCTFSPKGILDALMR